MSLLVSNGGSSNGQGFVSVIFSIVISIVFLISIFSLILEKIFILSLILEEKIFLLSIIFILER